MSKHPQLDDAVLALTQGRVIAYPTEAVFGVGCDPDSPEAIALLLQIKQRSKNKGLILIAADFEQLLPYIALEDITDEQKQRMLSTWPGAVTWVVPASKRCSEWLTGQFTSIAVRVTDHALVQQLCRAYGKPITSTSANLSGYEPGRSAAEVASQLEQQLAVIIDAPVGGRTQPSEIRDLATGQIFRAG